MRVFKGLRLKSVRRLTAGATDHEHPAWSPDGRTLAFAAGPADVSRIYLADRKGRFSHGLAPNGPRATRPRWAPDGRRIAFDARPLEGPSTVLVQDLPEIGREPRPLFPAREGDGDGRTTASIHAAFSPDGRFLAYACDAARPGRGTRHFHIWLVDLESGDRRQVTDEPEHSDAHPAFSPDGALLAFHRYEGENAHRSSLYLLNVTSGALLRATDANAFDKHPCFATPEVVIFHREHGDGRQELRALHVIEGGDAPLGGGLVDELDAKQPAVRVSRRGRIQVAFAGRHRDAAGAAGSPRLYDLYAASIAGLDPVKP